MKQRMVHLYSIFLGVVIVFTNGGCGEKTGAKPEQLSNPSANANIAVLGKTSALSLVDSKVFKNKTGNLVLAGSVSNTSSQLTSRVIATFKLFDKDGKDLGEATVSVENLDAQFSWVFETVLSDDSVVSAKFVEFSIKQ